MIKKIFNYSFIGYLALYPLIPTIVSDKFPLGDVLMLLYMGLFLIKCLSSKEERKKFIWRIRDCCKDIIVITMVLAIVIMLISTLYAPSKSLAISESFRYFTYVILYITIKYEFNIKKHFNILKAALVVPAFITFIYGIVQYSTGIGVKVDTNGTFRMESTLGYPTAFASYIIVIFFPLVMFAINEKNKTRKIFYSINVGLALFNLVITWSRNGWLALALGLVILAIVYNIKFLYALLACGVLGVAIPFIRERLLQLASGTINEGRIKLWKAAFKMIEEHPIKGVGNGNFSYLYDSYVAKYPELYVPGHSGFPTHNSYLKMWCEIGPLGALVFFSTYVFVGIKLFIANKKYKNKFQGFTTGVLVTFFSFLFVNLFDNMMFTPKVMTIFVALISMAITIDRKDYIQ